MIAAIGLLLQASVLDQVWDDPSMRGAAISACVMRADGSLLYERNSDVRLVPASVNKIGTALYALHRLGPGARLTTRFWREGTDRVIVDAPGNPLLAPDQLLQARTALGLRSGCDVAVRQAYRPVYPGGWEEDDLQNRYAAQVTAFTVDRGGFELWCKGGKLDLRPRNYGVRIARVGFSGRMRVKLDLKRRVLRVWGKLPQGEQQIDTLAIPEPDEAAAGTLGGRLTLTDDVPLREPDYEIQSPPLRELVRASLESSDNNVSESLLLMAACAEGALPREDSYPEANARINAFLTNVVGLDAASFKRADGSGLSRHNVVSSRSVGRLLFWAQSQPYFPTFYECLAAPGRGTLKSRLGGSSFAGKTGTMDLVNALAGYANIGRGDRVIVCVIINHAVGSSKQVRETIDRFIGLLDKLGDSGTQIAA